jgi:hypothetical protein
MRKSNKSIFNIVKNANDEGDFATTSFLQWFINEQVEEEASASQLVTKIKMVCDNPSALYLFDQELAQRVLHRIQQLNYYLNNSFSGTFGAAETVLKVIFPKPAEEGIFSSIFSTPAFLEEHFYIPVDRNFQEQESLHIFC